MRIHLLENSLRLWGGGLWFVSHRSKVPKFWEPDLCRFFLHLIGKGCTPPLPQSAPSPTNVPLELVLSLHWTQQEQDMSIHLSSVGSITFYNMKKCIIIIKAFCVLGVSSSIARSSEMNLLDEKNFMHTWCISVCCVSTWSILTALVSCASVQRDFSFGDDDDVFFNFFVFFFFFDCFPSLYKIIFRTCNIIKLEVLFNELFFLDKLTL